MLNDCLGLGFQCGDYSDLFTIVDLLTVVGLFFTGYQLIEPIHRLRMRYRGFSDSKISIFIGLSIFLSLVGVSLQFIPGEAIPLLGYNTFWQICSLIVVLIIGCLVFLSALRPIKKLSNTDRFIRLLIIFLGKDEKHISAIGSELGYFIEDVIKKVDKKKQDAYNILSICMDTKLIHSIVHNHIGSLNAILKIYSERKKIGELAIDNIQEEFISTIIQESLNSKDSIIAREIGGELYAGINQGMGIVSQRIFQNFEFIHRYDLFMKKKFAGSYKANGERNKDFSINYIKFFEFASKSFFQIEKTKSEEIKHIIHNINFHTSLGKGLEGFSGYNGILTKEFEENNFIGDILRNINHGINNNASEIIAHYTNIPIEFNEIGDELGIMLPHYKEPNNLFESLSWGCYRLLESISYIKETPENSRRIRDLCRNVYLDNNSSDPNIVKVVDYINSNLKKMILTQISKSNVKGYYSNMTRNFFHIFGNQIFVNKIDEKDKDFCFDVLKLLDKSLPDLYSGKFWGITGNEKNIEEDLQRNRREKAQKIIGDIFPSYMFYSPENHTLTYYFSDKLDKSVLDLSKIDDNEIILLNKQ